MSTLDERAVEVGQFSQPGQAHQPQAEMVGYYEPTQVIDLNRHGRLLVVADGVGGSASGDLSSRYAVQKILHDFYHSRELDLEKRLLETIQQTNRAIFDQNRRHPERRPLGTTLLAALIHQNKLIVASVGDGRAYVVWDQDIEHLTGETSSPQRQARETEAAATDVPKDSGLGDPETISKRTEQEALETPGPDISAESKPSDPSAETKSSNLDSSAEAQTPARSSAEEAKSRLLAEKEPSSPSPIPLPSAHSSNLPCALGLAEQVQINLLSRRLFPGDMVVLCSGGLNGYVSEPEIAQTVTQQPPALASRHLAELAAKRGSRDTLSVSVTRVLSKPITQAAPARQPMPLAPDWDTLTKPITKPLPVIPAHLIRPPVENRRRWPVYLAGLVALLLFGLVGFLAGGYWLTSNNPTPQAEQVQEGEVAGTASSQVNGGQAPADAPAANPQTITPPGQAITSSQATLTPTVGLVAQSDSPIPTPTGTPIGQRPGAATPPTTPTPQPSPLPTIALPAGCENRARFMGDVTVKDGTEFAPGETFEKVWSVTNYGTCPWGGGYTVRFTGGDPMGAAEIIPLRVVVQPESTGMITIPMVAPTIEGTYRGNWQLYSLAGEPFGPDLYLEIKAVPGALPANAPAATTLYDFVASAAQAAWMAGSNAYTVVETPIDRNLVIPDPEGVVAIGLAELRGDVESQGNVLLTHPHLELGLIEGVYTVTTPLQPTDAIIGSLGLPKAAAINDDGVTFELVFKPTGGQDQLLFSKLVKYEDSPVAVRQTLNTLQPGQTGAFILRAKGGASLSYDWATWIELRLVRP